jgi:prepilin-type N-terminal cleavage/methylation domain-containing protein
MKLLSDFEESLKSTGSPDFRVVRCAEKAERSDESGFSLIEVTIAMIILLVALLGVFVTFAYAVNYNAGNSSRAQALTVLQQEVERMRSAKFTSGGTDDLLMGKLKTTRTVTSVDNNRYRIAVTIDNNPSTPAIDTDESLKPTLKEITVEVTLDSPTPGWQTAVPATVILRRVKGN